MCLLPLACEEAENALSAECRSGRMRASSNFAAAQTPNATLALSATLGAARSSRPLALLTSVLELALLDADEVLLDDEAVVEAAELLLLSLLLLSVGRCW